MGAPGTGFKAHSAKGGCKRHSFSSAPSLSRLQPGQGLQLGPSASKDNQEHTSGINAALLCAFALKTICMIPAWP